MAIFSLKHGPFCPVRPGSALHFSSFEENGSFGPWPCRPCLRFAPERARVRLGVGVESVGCVAAGAAQLHGAHVSSGRGERHESLPRRLHTAGRTPALGRSLFGTRRFDTQTKYGQEIWTRFGSILCLQVI